jgi:hypothetical protein
MNNVASFFYLLAEGSEVPLRYFLNNIIGRWMTVLVPNQYGNASSKAKEIFIRILLALLAIIMIVPVIIGSILWVIFRYIGDAFLGKNNFILFKGAFSGALNNTFATWNLASFLPPCTLVDGVAYSNKRLLQIANYIKDFDFFCGQEVGGPEARYLAKVLKNNYKEFYSYIGKSNTPLLQSGLFFASKMPVLNVYYYPYSVKGMQIAIHRSFVLFELVDFYVAVTHPDSAQDAAGAEVRYEEIQQMLQTLDSFKDKPILFCADLNSDRYVNEAGYKLLVSKFPDIILQQFGNCKNCKDLTDHSYCPQADDVGGNNQPACITDTDILAHNRFNKTGDVECISIDFFGSNSDSLKIELLASNFFEDLTDHHLMEGTYEFKKP